MFVVRRPTGADLAAWAALGGRPPADADEGPPGLIAFEGERAVGALQLLRLEPTLQFVETVGGDDLPHPVLLALAGKLHETARPGRVDLLRWRRGAAEAFDRALVEAGFALHREKAFVERSLSGFVSPWRDPFRYRSLADVGEQAFCALLAEAGAGDPFEDPETRDVRAEFADLVEYAGEAFDAHSWFVAYEEAGAEAAGVLLPQRFADDPSRGTIGYVALRPAYRGRGLGRALHAAGLDRLARAGVQRYVGSTDIRNAPMRAVFRSNGCHETGRQVFYRPTGGLDGP